MDWTWILIGTAAAAAVMFVWLGIAWMALPHHAADFRGVPDHEGLTDALRDLPVGKAFFAYPFAGDYEGGQGDPALRARTEQGPNAMITVLPRGDCMGPGMFLRGLVLNLVEAFGLAVLCSLLAVPGLTDKVLVGAILGAFLGISGYGGMSNWMFVPWRFTWMTVFDKVVGFALMGLVLHFCLPAPPPA